MLTQNKSWPAPAKLNLFLHITGRRDDGYHELQTLFQFVDLCDWLSFEIRADGRVARAEPLQGVSEAEDLCLQAAELLKSKVAQDKLGVVIHLDKKLPMGGGLGGGSSDAATTLLVLNRLWRLDLSCTALCELGLQLGADVPVFVRGQAAWAEGIGEQLTSVEIPEAWYLILVPNAQVPTAKLYQSSDLCRNKPRVVLQDYLDGGGTNVFEPLARAMFPDVDEAFAWLEEFAATRMTGSGACLFAAFSSQNTAQKVLDQLPDKWQGFVTQGQNQSPLHKILAESV